MNDAFEARIQCPFYIRRSRTERESCIMCEPLMSEKELGFKVKQQTAFSSRAEMLDYVDIFCAERYTACPLYKAIFRNRERETKRNVSKEKTERQI